MGKFGGDYRWDRENAAHAEYWRIKAAISLKRVKI